MCSFLLCQEDEEVHLEMDNETIYTQAAEDSQKWGGMGLWAKAKRPKGRGGGGVLGMGQLSSSAPARVK